MVRVIPVLLIAAVAYWLAAPDPVTAGARTAAGTAARAAGAGVRSHWAAGRDGRKLTRTDRRDRWSKGGGFWRNPLRLEHGAVIGGKAAKGAGKLTAAAVRPVPGAVRAGWVQGRDRHRAKAGNRHRGLVLDPPWWHRVQPQVQGRGAGGGQVQVQPGDSPEVQVKEQPEGAGMRGIDIQDPKAGAVLAAFDWDDDEAGDAVMARAKDYESLIPEVLLREAGRCPHQTAYGHKGVTSVEFCGRKSKPGNPYGECAQHERDGVDEYGADGYLAAARRNTPAIPTTEGDPVTYAGIDELDNLTSVKDMAKLVADMAEESDFAQLVEFCKNASDETRDFGSDMAGDVAEFEEIAAKIGDLLAELADAAQKVDSRADELIGG